MNVHAFFRSLWLLAWAVAAPAGADAVIELQKLPAGGKAPAGETVRVLVHGGTAMLQAQPDTLGKALRFDQQRNVFHLLDHRRRTVMEMDDAAVIQFTDQTQAMLAMARGFAEQLALLPPKQRAKLEGLLGDNPLAHLAMRGAPSLGRHTLRTAGSKTVGGVSCRRLEVLGNGNKLAEICLAAANALPLPSADYATLDAMRQLAQHLAERAAPLAQELGVPLPPLDDAKLAGLPIEIKSLAGKQKDTLVLNQIVAEPVAPQLLDIPAGYVSKPLTAWKF